MASVVNPNIESEFIGGSFRYFSKYERVSKHITWNDLYYGIAKLRKCSLEKCSSSLTGVWKGGINFHDSVEIRIGVKFLDSLENILEEGYIHIGKYSKHRFSIIRELLLSIGRAWARILLLCMGELLEK